MRRRRFLALVGAAGAAAGTGVGVSAAGAGSLPSTDADQPGIGPQRGDGDIDQASFPTEGDHRILWSVRTAAPRAALTFDDGPDPTYTPRVLRALDDAGVRATFLMMGHCVQQWPDLAREVLAAGHEIGTHTLTHRNLAFESPEQTRIEIERGTAIIEETLGVRCRWFRPPRGQLTGSTVRYAAELGQDTVMWSVTRGVLGVGTPDAVADHLARNVGPGDILILHDGVGRAYFTPDAPSATLNRQRREVEVQALPQVLEEAAGRGLQLGTLAELLEVEAGPAWTPSGAAVGGR